MVGLCLEALARPQHVRDAARDHLVQQLLCAVPLLLRGDRHKGCQAAGDGVRVAEERAWLAALGCAPPTAAVTTRTSGRAPPRSTSHSPVPHNHT